MQGRQHDQLPDSAAVHHAASKAKEKIRLNSLKLLHFDTRDIQLINDSYQQVLNFAEGLQLSLPLTTQDIMAALQAAHTAASEYFTVKHALAWNTDFVIPADAIAADSMLFRDCGYDFSAMCRYKQRRLAHNRLSAERLVAIFGSTGTKIPGVSLQDFNTLLEFATCGITPIVSPSFKPEAINVAPLRDRYIKLQHTINKLLYKLYSDGTMIFLTKEDALRINGLHLSPQHHADSKGKPEGRIIGDLSGQHIPTFTPLNGSAHDKDELRATIALKWGEIKHPTVDQLVKMVLTAADIHGWNNIILWKKDLKGAFNLLNYNPDFCKWFAFPLTGDIVVIHLAGLFGWIGMPHAFQVLTRVLQRLCRHLISGLCYWYVDDLMAVSPKVFYDNDSELVDYNVQQLLGQGSIALAKSQHDRCLEFLGWDFNLDTRTITLCARNMNKLVHALFSFHSTDNISISHIQRLASLISRTSILSKHMRPYTHTLHTITSGYNCPHVKIKLSELAQTDIMMWRAFVLLLIANPSRLSRPMESFRHQTAQYIIRYDASLTGLGVGLYAVNGNNLITYAALQLPFSVDSDSSNQNTMEFIAVILGLLLAWRKQITTFHYDLHGDNMSSLAWARSDRVNSLLARRANIVYTTVSMHLNAHLVETEHVPGAMNVVFDGLSRNVSPEQLGLDPSLMYTVADDLAMNEFIQLCNPALRLTDMTSHTSLLKQCYRLLSPQST